MLGEREKDSREWGKDCFTEQERW